MVFEKTTSEAATFFRDSHAPHHEAARGLGVVRRGEGRYPLRARWAPSSAPGPRSGHAHPAPCPPHPGRPGTEHWLRTAGGSLKQKPVEGWTPLSASRQGPRRAPGTAGNGLADGAADGVSTPDSLRPPGSRIPSYLLGDRKPPVPPHPSPPPLAHGEPGLPSLPPPTHVLEPPAVSASPGERGGLRHGLHRTRRGGSHSSSGAQARSDRTHGARTAGRVAYYGGRFGLTSASLPPAPSSQTPDGAAAQAQRRPSQTCVCRGCTQHSALPNGSEHQVRGAGPRREGRGSSV
ncbi:ribonucleoprotein RB97D-like [Myotis myotis]|uniref:ribonucleoprotein RB97D-like n=1 Tax=Myotis myotis TaxID=51298 RepID=UPI00174D7800|nr:ribonucleoprotein RB97D-like [Myotis myotis]